MKGMDYYDNHYAAFIARTQDIDMEPFYIPFQNRLTPGSRILDIGCGSGRDLKYFKQAGYEPIGLEPSSKLSDHARQYANCEVLQTTIQDFETVEKYDGIWASASLLHLTPDELTLTLEKLATLMFDHSICYCSFKYGEGELRRDGRYYNDLTLDSFTALKPGALEIISAEVTEQDRPELLQKWLNVFLQRKV